MYTAYFGLAENPFNMTPDLDYLFLSNHHKQALDHLLYGINGKKGFMAISGGIGTGKTTLCRALLNQMDSSTKSALIFNTYISEIEFLETINQEFGININNTKRTKKYQIDILNKFLLENFRQGGNAILVIDEAQNLSPALLEQIRMLSNLETEKEKLIQIVLVGQPELMRVLASPALRQLNERITVRYHLKALDRRATQSYIEHRLALAGNRGSVRFSRSALNTIFSYSRGNPRRINAVCDRSLLIAYCKDEFEIDKTIVSRAVDDIRGNFKTTPYAEKTGLLQRRIAPAAAVMLMAFIVANLGGLNVVRQFSGLFSRAKDVAVIESRAFIRKPVEFAASALKTPPDPAPKTSREPTLVQNEAFAEEVQPQKQVAGLIHNKQESLDRLFTLFNVQKAQNTFSTAEIYPDLFTFEGDPALYLMFEKPFRIRVSLNNGNETGYLLIQRVTTGGAIAIDVEGNKRPVTEDFILAHWDGEISWVYPYEHMSAKLSEGMSGLSVLKTQQMLQQLGYFVEPRGVYDSTTSEEVMRFQLNFGLKADGTVDTPTKALLYQMSA